MTFQLVRDLLLGVNLQVNSKLVQIVEIEVYLFPDPYIHGSDEQKYSGRWYFHKMGSNPGPVGFKNGTYKGLDLSWGTPEAPGGFLIRSICNGTELIEGPSKVVDFILAETNSASIQDLVKLSACYPPRCDDPSFPLSLISLSPTERRTQPIFSGPRVGLTYRSDSASAFYYGAKLRFTTSPKLKKNKFSLVLSFLGNSEVFADLEQTKPAGRQEDKPIVKIECDEHEIWAAIQTFGTSEKIILKWWQDYCQGMTSFEITEAIGKTVPQSCRLYGFLRRSFHE